ncbi:MAG TPA: protein kinase [Candidatus Cryosericum sp.]|nr:protein kinase [Candidatus Cryosericum sp.]
MTPARGIAWRIGALMTALVGGLVLASTGAVWLRTWSLAGPALDAAVLRARDLVDEAVAARLDRLDLVTRLLASDGPFRAYVAEGDRPSILDNLADRMTLYGCDAFVIADARGDFLADTRRPTEAAPGPVGQSVVEAALLGGHARGVWVERDGRIYLAAATPIEAGPASVLVALEEVNDVRAMALRQATGVDLVFFSRSGPFGPVLPGAATLPLPRARLATLVAAPSLGLTAVLDGAGGTEPRRIEADGAEHAALAAPLAAGDAAPATAAPAHRAGFVALRSVAGEVAWFAKIQGALLLVGLLAAPIAIGVGVLLARRITRPIGVLVHAIERARAGDYDAPLPPETGDEVGVLSSAFRSMMVRLKQQQEVDAWIGTVASQASSGARTASASPPAAGHLKRTQDTTATLDPPGAPVAGPGGAGTVLQGRFRLVALIGAGGMGTVWKARDESLHEDVAVKILVSGGLTGRPDLLERFRQEIRLSRRVTHRNVLRTHELLDLGSSWAILMEYVDGTSLDRVLAEGRLPFSAGVRIASQVADGLQAAHARGVVHRDLKPSNILVDALGTVKISDFGLARSAGVGEGLTIEGAVLGTPLYMSPEQAMGRTADERSDVYSAGVVFYEILCGRRPFDADNPVAVLRAHIELPPPPPRDLNPALLPSMAAFLLRALAKDPALRFASARDMAEGLDRAAAEGGAA